MRRFIRMKFEFFSCFLMTRNVSMVFIRFTTHCHQDRQRGVQRSTQQSTFNTAVHAQYSSPRFTDKSKGCSAMPSIQVRNTLLSAWAVIHFS